ncbi:MAG: hypothetical protein P8X75_02335 [Limibacillus sp.]|jgi:Rieske Fe-S protein
MAEIESEIETSGAGKAACKPVNQGPAVTRLPKPAHDWRRFSKTVECMNRAYQAAE